MNHPFSNYPFTTLLHQHLKKQHLSQEKLGELIRVTRECVNRVCVGAEEPSLRFLTAVAYVLCLTPHEARVLFSSAGYDLDSPHPKYSRARAVLDVPHDLSDPAKTKATLDQLALFGLAPEDKDSC